MNDPDDSADTQWDELAKVGSYPTLEQAHEHGLVVLAMREPCWVAPAEPTGGFNLHTEPAAAPAISQELQAYDLEQQQLQHHKPTTLDHDLLRFPAGWGLYTVWALTLVAMFAWQRDHPAFADSLTSSSIGLLENHQWWRPFTALFLHADFPHLVGNLTSGLIFGTLVARSIGALRAWLLILACGTTGNAITSFLTYPEPFVSLGASTAVFGALGILTGLGLTALWRSRVRLPWLRLMAPLFAGLVLLGWLGGGHPGGNTDVLGHVFGFSSGLTAGSITGWLSPATAGASIAGTSTAAHDEPT